MAKVTVDSVEIIRKGNPAAPLIAYINETCSIDPNIILKIVKYEVSGRALKLRNGSDVYRVIDNKNREICLVDHDGKVLLEERA
jgi:hypothetical protein